MVAIRQILVEKSKWDIKCPYPMKPRFIVVHNTANDATANNEISYMIANNNEVSFHFAVDDIEIVQGILENRNAWHCGDGGEGEGNRNGIAVEICYSKTGGSRFDSAEENASRLIASLMEKHSIDINNVKRHYDFANDHKYCPHRTMDKGWGRFLNMVRNAGGLPVEPSNPEDELTPDQIFEVGSIAKFSGIFKIEDVLIESNCIYCNELAGRNKDTIPATPLIKCDSAGNKTENQIFQVGDYFYCDNKFTVLAIDILNNEIRINVDGKLIWIKSGPCDELKK